MSIAMDDRAFAESLSAWVDPSAVLKVARSHAAADPKLEQPGFVPVPGKLPGGARAIALDTLVGKFLRGFQLPAEYVDLLVARFPDVPQLSWDYARGLRFEGDVLSGPETGDENNILLVRDRASFARMVAIPVAFLVRQTLSIAGSWINSPADRRDFLEHSVYSDWLVFIEYTVAAALGHADLARSAQPNLRAQVLYGDGTAGVALVSEPPFHDASTVRKMFEGLIQIESVPFDFTKAPAAGRQALSADDGFVAIDEMAAVQPWRNISRWRNECSPYALFGSQHRSSSLVIDTYYGRVFDFSLEENLGVYGVTEAMPDRPWARGLTTYLRSPYRKVPCYTAKDLGELQAVFSRVRIAGDGSPPLFRGQSAEYALRRTPNAREVLYGDASAVEPSLLATSTRSSQPLENVLPAWVQLVRAFLMQLWGEQLAMPGLDPRLSVIINEDAQRLMTGLDLHLYAVSLAQHYGLPTMGLDVTGNVNVALFFALHKSERAGGRNVRFRRKAAGDPKSVLYVFAPDQRHQMNHEEARARTTGEGRPERQGAKFLITGWGYHRNSVARHLAMAIYLDPAGDFGTLPSARQLFPERSEDLFGDYLERALEGGLPAELRKYVEQLYWVADD